MPVPTGGFFPTAVASSGFGKREAPSGTGEHPHHHPFPTGGAIPTGFPTGFPPGGHIPFPTGGAPSGHKPVPTGGSFPTGVFPSGFEKRQAPSGTGEHYHHHHHPFPTGGALPTGFPMPSGSFKPTGFPAHSGSARPTDFPKPTGSVRTLFPIIFHRPTDVS